MNKIFLTETEKVFMHSGLLSQSGDYVRGLNFNSSRKKCFSQTDFPFQRKTLNK